MSDLINKLDSFKELQPNWNGYKSRRISRICIRRSKRLVSLFPDNTDVFPVNDGSIQFDVFDHTDNNRIYCSYTIGVLRFKYLIYSVGTDHEETVYGNKIKSVLINLFK